MFQRSDKTQLLSGAGCTLSLALTLRLSPGLGGPGSGEGWLAVGAWIKALELESGEQRVALEPRADLTLGQVGGWGKVSGGSSGFARCPQLGTRRPMAQSLA